VTTTSPGSTAKDGGKRLSDINGICSLAVTFAPHLKCLNEPQEEKRDVRGVSVVPWRALVSRRKVKGIQEKKSWGPFW